MFNEKFSAIVSAPTGKLKNKKGQSVRSIHFTLKAEFDDAVAAGLDKHGKAGLAGLRTRGLAEIKIPINAIAAKIKMRSGDDRVTFNATGVELVGKANMNKEDVAPLANITWQIDFTEKVWQFLGKNFGKTAQIDIEARQLEIEDIDSGSEDESEAAN